jgi:phosphoribosylglycinamide formyltransferase-1
MKKNIIVLISGRGSNLKSIISAAKDVNYPAIVSLVISDNSKAQGLDIARHYSIDNVVIERGSYDSNDKFEEVLSKKITQYNPSLICLAGFMKILSKGFVEKFMGKIINIHPSLLPKYKGLNTHQKAINSGDKYSGCTVHYVNDKMDDGEIIAQQEVTITADETVETLKEKVLDLEHKLYPNTIKALLS